MQEADPSVMYFIPSHQIGLQIGEGLVGASATGAA